MFLSGISKNTASFDNVEDIAKGIEFVGALARQIFDSVCFDINFQFITGFDELVELFCRLVGNGKSAINAVAVKNSCVRLGDDGFYTGNLEGEGGVLP